MYKYSTDLDTGEWKSEPTFDVSAFEGIEVLQHISEMMEEKIDPVWIVTVGGSIFSIPLAHNDVIFFGCNDKRFYAVSTAGKLVWSFGTDGVILSSPCFVGHLVVFGSYDHNLYALDRRTGSLAWKFPARDKIFSNPCFDGSRIFFGSKDGNFYCLNTDGKLLWKRSTNGPIETHPMVHKGVLYFGSNDRNIYALDAESGDLKWKFPTKGDPRAGFAVWNDVIYFTGMEKTAYGINTDGRKVFSFLMKDFGSNTVVADEGVIYIASRDWHLYALRPSGELLWKFQAGHALEVPAISQDKIFIGSIDHNLYALDKKTGRLLWKFTGKGPMESASVIYKGVLYVGSWDCNLYALDPQSGRMIWRFPTSLSTQSRFDLDQVRPESKFQIIWKSEAKKPEEKKEEAHFTDYGKMKSDYAAGPSKNYIKGKGGYVQ